MMNKNLVHNEAVKERYDHNPLSFCCDSSLTNTLPGPLVDFAHYIFSIYSSSASPERVFSLMKDMVRTKRSSFTGANVDMRLTMRSLLPAKRKLENLLLERNIKKSKLFKKSNA